MRQDSTVLPIIVFLSASYLLAFGASTAGAQSRNGFDFSDALVPVDQILWGGVRRDGIPSIDKPKFLAAAEAKSISKSDRILGVYRNGIAKAYPIRILEKHEVVNDYFGKDAVVVSYCPLCFSGMSFLVSSDELTFTFGVSGLLYNSDVLLYDHQSGSLWSQIMMQSVSGPLKGTTILPIATSHTSWREWRSRHPNTLLLSSDTGFAISYRDRPYQEYKGNGRLMFPVANKSGLYAKKERTLGITLGDTYKAYPFKELRKNGQSTFQDTVGGTPLSIEWNRKESFARAMTADGEEIPTVIVYWFAWYAFHPGTDVFQADSG
jgi:hypothetical protein